MRLGRRARLLWKREQNPASDDLDRHHCENTAPEASRIRKVTAQGRFPGSRFIGMPAFPGVAPSGLRGMPPRLQLREQLRLETLRRISPYSLLSRPQNGRAPLACGDASKGANRRQSRDCVRAGGVGGRPQGRRNGQAKIDLRAGNFDLHCRFCVKSVANPPSARTAKLQISHHRRKGQLSLTMSTGCEMLTIMKPWEQWECLQ